MPDSKKLSLCDVCTGVFEETRPSTSCSIDKPKRPTTRQWHEDAAHFYVSVQGGIFGDIVFRQCDLCLFVWNSLTVADRHTIRKLAGVKYGEVPDRGQRLFMPSFKTFQLHLDITYTIKRHDEYESVYVWELSFPVPQDENYENEALEFLYIPATLKKRIFFKAMTGTYAFNLQLMGLYN
jgi:hypothetical protein